MKTSNVVAIKNDATIANDAGKAERLSVLRAIDTAEDLLGNALIHGLLMTAKYGPTSTDEVSQAYTRCKSPKVYSSWFNRGAKAAAIIGEAAAVELINKASQGSGGFAKARDALGTIGSQATAAGSKTLAPKAAKAAVTFALKSAGDKSAERKEIKKTTATVRTRSSVNMAAAALEAGKGHKELAAFVKLAANTATRLPEREGREDLHRRAVAALADACELWTQLAK